MAAMAPACGKSTSGAPRPTIGAGAGEAGAAGEVATPAGGANSAAGVDSGGGAPSGGAAVETQAGSPVTFAGQPAAGAGGEPPAVVPPQLTLRSITLSQTEELPLMQAGAVVATADRPAPLVAGKRALVRAFVDLEPGFVARPLIGVLDLKTPSLTRTLVNEITLAQSSQQDDLTTTFVFNVDARDLGTDSSYRVRILEDDTTPITVFPDAGYLPLDAQKMQPFELVLVPFLSNGFGPLLGDDEVAALRRRLVALYPATDVEVSKAPPVTLGFVVSPDGTGWDDALDRIYAERAAAAPARDVFYFGMLAPDDSYSTYCAGDCVLGLSTIADASDVDSRGSVGVTIFQDGSGGKVAWDTVAHELGHALGRDHAPCGLNDPDPSYPYPAGGLGSTYGYDFDLMKLIKPKQYRDVMSYCTPVWISDYTYRGIFDRLDYIGQEAFRTLALAPSQQFRVARIRRTGESVWLGQRPRRGAARALPVDLLDSAGRRVASVSAQVAHVDHARGGYVWLPASELATSGAASVDLRPLGGSLLPL